MDAKYPTITAEYCRDVCKTRCDVCPMPRVLPAAQTGIAAFIAVGTQWRHGFGGRTGLDNTACLKTLALYLPRWRRESPAAFNGLQLPDLMEDVQIIEHALLAADGERREQEEQERQAKAT